MYINNYDLIISTQLVKLVAVLMKISLSCPDAGLFWHQLTFHWYLHWDPDRSDNKKVNEKPIAFSGEKNLFNFFKNICHISSWLMLTGLLTLSRQTLHMWSLYSKITTRTIKESNHKMLKITKRFWTFWTKN